MTVYSARWRQALAELVALEAQRPYGEGVSVDTPEAARMHHRQRVERARLARERAVELYAVLAQVAQQHTGMPVPTATDDPWLWRMAQLLAHRAQRAQAVRTHQAPSHWHRQRVLLLRRALQAPAGEPPMTTADRAQWEGLHPAAQAEWAEQRERLVQANQALHQADQAIQSAIDELCVSWGLDWEALRAQACRQAARALNAD